MAAFSALTGNFVSGQILVTQVIAPVITTALSPFLVELSNTVNAAAPNVALSPADAARAVIRTALTQSQGEAEALSSGLNRDRFGTLLKITGNPPSPEAMAIALRRGFVDEAGYRLAISQGDLRNEYADLVQKLAVQQPSPESAMRAELEGQLDHATAFAKYQAFGGDPAEYDWQFDTQGSAPTPVELGDMANRGIIPWTGTGPDVTSFEQGFLEGPWRNKWAPAMRAIAQYHTPPRTVTAMYREGAYTEAQALARYKEAGLSDEDAAAYLKGASVVKVAKAKELAESTVLKLYADQIIDRPQALALTEALGYSASEADYIVQVEELRTMMAALQSAVGRVHTLFVGHKIDVPTATAILGELNVPADRISSLLGIWSIEHRANVKILTEAQTVSAWASAILSTADAIAGLVQLGYDAADAQTLLAIHNKGALTAEQLAGGVDSVAPAAGG